MTHRIFLFLLLLVGATPLTGVHAQTGQLFDADHMLPSSFVNQVFLDREGFVWVVTRNGLARYDGYKARIFKKEQGEGLTSNYVNCMAQDDEGRFYFGMYGALQTYDGKRFAEVEVTDLNGRKVGCYVNCILCRKNGDVMIGTSGHGLLVMAGAGKAIQLGGDFAQFGTIQRMEEDGDGRLWLLTEDGRAVVAEESKVVATYFDNDEQGIVPNRICKDKEGRIYIGTRRHGVLQFTGGSFTHIAPTGTKKVASLYFSRDGKLMIGYDGQGVAIFDPATGEITDNPYRCPQLDISQAKVESVVEDRTGNVWLGMLQKGIFMQPAKLTQFGYLGYKLGTRNVIGQACVISTLIDSHERIWVGTDRDGLYLLDSERQLLRHYKENFPQTIFALLEDKQGRIWIGSYNEGCGYIGSDGSFHRPALPQGEHISVFGLAMDAHGSIYLGTMGKGLIKIYTDGSTKSFTTHANAPTDRTLNSLTNDYISKLSSSPDGRRIYVSTTMGLCCLDTEYDSWMSCFHMNCLNYGTAMRFATEIDRRIWLGTNDGLLCYDLETRNLRKIGGLAGVASIESDSQGKLWVATDHGLIHYDPQTEQSVSYYVDNGLQSNEFSDAASCVAADGQMVFGGVGGITWFRPEEVEQPRWDATVRLIDFVADVEKDFSLQFSTLTYDNPELITYLYSIDDEPFVRLNPGVNSLHFTHFPAGTYHFCIKAEREGQQTPELEFTVTVHGAWWHSWWAYCLYALAFALFVSALTVCFCRRQA